MGTITSRMKKVDFSSGSRGGGGRNSGASTFNSDLNLYQEYKQYRNIVLQHESQSYAIDR